MKLKKHSLNLFFLILFTSIQMGWSQLECGSEPPVGYEEFMQQRIASLTTTKSASEPIALPIQHIISRDSLGQNPTITEAQLQNVMDELNAKFAPMNISFYNYAAPKYMDNSEWNVGFNRITYDGDLLQFEEEKAINIFYFTRVFRITDGEQVNLCGYARFPGSGNRAVMNVSCSQNGSTTSHELGHYFSLLHTHETFYGEELVKRTNCGVAGDFFCDTPADPRLTRLIDVDCNYIGTAVDANGDMYQPDPTNLMSYARRSCRLQSLFTTQQQQAIVASVLSDRAYLLPPTDPANCSMISDFPYRENFDTGFGDWANSSDDDIQWIRGAGRTPSPGTGPQEAHEDDFYLFTESSSNVVPAGSPNKSAVLRSPCLDYRAADGGSIEFRYYMFGSNMGTLQVLASTDNGTSYTPIWSKEGNQGERWYRAKINLDAFAGSVLRLQLQGITGNGFRSDMAVDNIKIKASTCTDYADLPLADSFENGDGRWKQSSNDSADWTLQKGSNPIAASDGKSYISISSQDSINKNAFLTSSCLDLIDQQNASLAFDYHVSGSETTSLSINISKNNGKDYENIWSTEGNQGTGWNSGFIDLSSYSSTVLKIQFDGKTGATGKATIALDHVKINLNTEKNPDTFDEILTELYEVKVSPIPIASGMLSIDIPVSKNSEKRIPARVTDILGKTVEMITLNEGSNRYAVDQLSKGIYFLLIHDGTNLISKKFIKK